MNETKTLSVNGMHCASCASVIKRKLEKMSGVESCEVNFGTETANIHFDTDIIGISDMNGEIEKLGYSLTDTNSTIHEGHDMMTPLSSDTQVKDQKLKELARLRKQVFIAMPMVVISIFVMAWEIGISPFGLLPKMPDTLMEFFDSLMPILASYALFVIGSTYLLGVWRFIKYRSANMDTLVGIGTSVAFLYSFFMSVFSTSSQNYYDVTIVVIGLITLGKFLEARSKLKTGEAIEKLIGLQAKNATVLRNGKEIEIPVDQVAVGDVCIVRPGQKIPVDGVVIEGHSSIDESMITGESVPVDKNINDTVIGSTYNKQGFLKIKAVKVGKDTMLSQIIKMVEHAQGTKAPIENLADRISAVFVPVVLIFAVIIFLVWIIVGSNFMPLPDAFRLAVLCFVGVLVIACPCAMGLATPTAVIVGVGKAAQNGILVKDAESLENFGKINFMVLDKTGTITSGHPELTEIINVSHFEDNHLLRIAATLEKNSSHPLARAVVERSEKENLTLKKSTDFTENEGKGVRGKIDDIEYFAGNLKMAEDLSLNIDKNAVDQLASKGATPIILMTKDKILGYFGVADSIKKNTRSVIQELRKLGIKTALLSGDNRKTADHIAKIGGIEKVFAPVLPNDKAKEVIKLQESGHRVAMVGDGINDAPALTTANVGVAMGNGTDVAIESAGITLLGGQLANLPKAVRLARATMKTIKQNLFWAFIYNIIGIPIAAGLLYPIWGILLSPAIAGAAMGLSSVFVVGNSLLLKKARI